jgi:O-methyltransferase involved in polyketide biosynthesis
MGMRAGTLTPVEETALLTLYCRALDNRRPQPILGDSLADTVTAGLDYDFAGLGVMPSTERFVALRAKMLDARVRALTAQNPDAVVIELGAGLSSAVFRVDPPESVDWYTVDLPAVIALRRAALPEHAQEHSVAASLVAHDWLGAIPGDRPAIVFADGLFAFLSESTVVAVVGAICRHFPSGMLLFYDYGKVSPIGRKAGTVLPTSKRMTRLLHSAWRYDGFADAHHPETWNPRLALVEEACALQEPDVAAFSPTWRLIAALSYRSPAIARKARVLSYRF